MIKDCWNCCQHISRYCFQDSELLISSDVFNLWCDAPTFVWSFELRGRNFGIFQLLSIFLKQTAQGVRCMNEWQPNSQKHEDCSGRQRRKNSAAVTNVTFHLTHRKEYQSKLLVFYSKGGRCSFWGLLHCDDRRSPWWGNRDGLQHDSSCSNTVMIRINCKS